MRKNYLIIGIISLLTGTAFLALLLSTDTSFESLFSGLTGSFIVCGLFFTVRYFYWNSPHNRERGLKKLDYENIELHDELKEKVRGKTAQYTYLIGLIIISISVVIFYVLDTLNIIENGTLFMLFLCGYLMFQIICGRIIFHQLIKKY